MEMSEKGKSGLKVFLLRLHRNVYAKVFPDFIEELNGEIEGFSSVLDLGCGNDSPLRHFPHKLHSEGVDIFPGYIDESKITGIHDAYHNMNVLDIDKKFKSGSFDCVVALDLIEHLTKEEGFELLKKMENIAKKKVIVFTPNGFVPQGNYDSNPWQEHKSGWTAEEMRALGYRVIGVNGLKSLRGELARLRFRPKYFWWIISDLTQLFVRNRPEKAYQILCIKDK
jgi:predicted TPR repeat methyltransferase